MFEILSTVPYNVNTDIPRFYLINDFTLQRKYIEIRLIVNHWNSRILETEKISENENTHNVGGVSWTACVNSERRERQSFST